LHEISVKTDCTFPVPGFDGFQIVNVPVASWWKRKVSIRHYIGKIIFGTLMF